MPHKSFSVFLARCATDFVVLLHIIKQGASNQSCGVKKGEKLCKMSILDFDFLAAKNRTAGFILYLLVGWTGLGLAFALVDLLIALPIPKDENGMIEIRSPFLDTQNPLRALTVLSEISEGIFLCIL